MKNILIPMVMILVACSPASNAEPQDAAPTSMIDLKAGTTWTLVPDESSIKFSAVQTGDEFTGAFKTFDAAINFDPDDLDAAAVAAFIDMGSYEAGDSERNDALKSKDWFFIKSYPKATFISTDFAQTGEGTYDAKGTLTIKDVSKPVTLPITLSIDGNKAVMLGSVRLNRGDYGIGQGAWATDEWVSLDVKVDVKVTATR